MPFVCSCSNFAAILISMLCCKFWMLLLPPGVAVEWYQGERFLNHSKKKKMEEPFSIHAYPKVHPKRIWSGRHGWCRGLRFPFSFVHTTDAEMASRVLEYILSTNAKNQISSWGSGSGTEGSEVRQRRGCHAQGRATQNSFGDLARKSNWPRRAEHVQYTETMIDKQNVLRGQQLVMRGHVLSVL